MTTETKQNYETVNTFDLKRNDIVVSHNATLRLLDREVFNSCDEDRKYGPRGFVAFKTTLVRFEPGVMTRQQAENWTIQGNSRAMWTRLT